MKNKITSPSGFKRRNNVIPKIQTIDHKKLIKFNTCLKLNGIDPIRLKIIEMYEKRKLKGQKSVQLPLLPNEDIQGYSENRLSQDKEIDFLDTNCLKKHEYYKKERRLLK